MKTTPFTDEQIRYLSLLSRNFPNIATASTEIINLEAILNLPKGTEHFLADLHGEYEAFQHVLHNASGTIKRKVKEIFSDTLSMREQKELCTLIYYPEQKLVAVKRTAEDDAELNDWYFITINRLVKVCRNVSSKYTRSKVQKALPADFSYIIQELLHESLDDPNKQAYVDVVVRTIITTDQATSFIVAMCKLIQRLTIDMLHILGDVFDRGPFPHKIMDLLCNYHNFDVQWGNHDILWMGAAAGNDASIANVVRIALRYSNQDVLEDGYGINLLPLATFAMETYKDDPCLQFQSKGDKDYTTKRKQLIAKMHKAISIIQFKLEAEIINRQKEFNMADRLLFNHVDFEKGTIEIAGKTYDLSDKNFPTVNPKKPYQLTAEEAEVVKQIHNSFVGSEKLRKHIDCLFRNGSMYKVSNGNLLYHASIPLNEDGTLKPVIIDGQYYKGKELLKEVDALIRKAYFGDHDDPGYQFALDYVWYLWCGCNSPAFDKDKMATFERYFIKEKETHKEKKGVYYVMRDDEQVCDRILDEFEVTGQFRHIINGHVPVKTIKGESPVKANGKLMVIDGGFSKAYQPETGIAGYTLVFHSRGFQLVQHEPFTSIQKAVDEGQDIKSTYQLVEMSNQRILVRHTDVGRELAHQIQDLEALLSAYRNGQLSEREYRPFTNKS